MRWLGAHVSAAGGVENAPARGSEIGANCIQIFSANQRQWTPKPLSDSQISQWWQECEIHDLKRVIVHSSYLINLSADTDEKMLKSHTALIDELSRSQNLGVHGVVLHPGSHLGAGEEEGLKAIAESLDTIFEATEELHGKLLCGEREEGMKILLENTAGQGTNLGYKFSHLSEIMRLVNSKSRSRLGVCLDTCHAFAAGYDISTESGWDQMWKEYDNLLGPETLRAVHVNDSLKGCGSRRDRHAGIAIGEIGETPFRRLMIDDRFLNVPMTLETPSGMGGWAEEIATMRSWEN